jgi:hypothetical protein
MSEVVGLPNNTYKPIAPSFVNFKKGALDTQLQIIKFTSCLPMVGGTNFSFGHRVVCPSSIHGF